MQQVEMERAEGSECRRLALARPGYHILSARTQSQGLHVLSTKRKWNMMDTSDKKNEQLES